MSKKGRQRAKSTPKKSQPLASDLETVAAEETYEVDDTDESGDGIAEEAPEFVPPTWQHDLLDVETHPATAKDLRRLMADWRHGRASRRLWDLLSDGYMVLFAVVVIGAMVGNAIYRAQGDVASCVTPTCLTGRTLLPWAAFFGVLAVTLTVARLFGPVVASAAEGFWLMDAPVRRSRILRGRLIIVIIAAGLISAALGALVAALTGSSLTGIGIWAAAAGLGASGLTSLAAAEQGADRHLLLKILQWLAGVIAVGVLLVVVSVAAGWVSLPFTTDLGVELAWYAAGAAALVLVVSIVVALVRLDTIRRARLVSGGSLVSSMQGAMFALDFGLMRDILVERDAVERGHVRPTRGRGLGLSALVWRDVQRLYRYPKNMLLVIVSIVVPYAVNALGLGVLSPTISGLALMGALVPLLGSLRVLTRTSGLMRTMPFTTAQVRQAAMVVPAFVALVWTMLILPAFLGVGGSVVHLDAVTALSHAVVTGLAGLLGAIRWVSDKRVNYNAPLVATPGIGAMPPGLIFNLVRGFDVVAFVTAPLLFGLPFWVSLVIAAIAFFLLRGTFNPDEIAEMQEEQKRMLAEAKGGASAGPKTKTKIAPPKR